MENNQLIRELNLRSRDAMIASTAAILWGDEHSVLNNGSMFFVDTGQTLFAVTAAHVYRGYCDELDARQHSLRCQIDGLAFDPIERLINLGRGPVDIATFRITANEISQIDRVPIRWPPHSSPQKDERLLFCGIPGEGRSRKSLGIVGFKHFVGMLWVETVNETTLSFSKPPNEELTDATGSSLPPDEDIRLGGLSGGPIAVLRESERGYNWTLAGVISEGHPSFPIVRAVRADLINADGTIRDVD